MFRSKSEKFIVQDDGEELFVSWSMLATVAYLRSINCDHPVERIAQAIDRAYKQSRSPMEKLELIIDIREGIE